MTWRESPSSSITLRVRLELGGTTPAVFYLHHFLSAQPKLNLRNSAVVATRLEVGASWLDWGVDGFRMDAVVFMAHDALLRDSAIGAGDVSAA